MKSVCIFAGANKGTNKAYSEIAHSLGRELVKNNLSMVYGGGSVGLMNEIANEVLENEGEVTGVITQRLKDVEVAHKNLTKLFIVDSMHERKAKMAEISDAVISLPGGVGTWEEFFEALAWNQLGIHSKPIILLNVEGYYDELYALSRIVRDKNGIIVDPLHKTTPILTKYEKTRILGQRAKQINSGNEPFISVDRNVLDGYLIAQEELAQKMIPFIIRRPLPNGGSEYWKLSDLEDLH